MKKITIAILAIAITAAGAIFVFGQTESGEEHMRRGAAHGGKMHKRGKRGQMMFRHLDLTDAQKGQMKAIRQASRESTAGLRESLRQTRTQLRELGTDGTFDQAAVETLAAQQADVHRQLIIEKEKVKAQMFAILTPEQKSKLEEMKANFAERSKERMERRKARFGEKQADQ